MLSLLFGLREVFTGFYKDRVSGYARSGRRQSEDPSCEIAKEGIRNYARECNTDPDTEVRYVQQFSILFVFLSFRALRARP